jgi:hypothetical protein
MTTASLSTTEIAANLRKAYKALGWSSRKISVKSEYFSMGSSIDVTVKDASVDFAKVRTMAEGAEQIRRCEITHEILSGGNLYVGVALSRDVEQEIAADHLEACEAAVLELDNLGPNIHADVARTKCTISRENAWSYRVWNDGRAGMNVNDGRVAALYVALYTRGWA